MEWSEWLPHTALHARMVLFACLPSLAQKSTWHYTCLPELLQNFRSVFLGIGLHDILSSLHLSEHINILLWTSWFCLGEEWANCDTCSVLCHVCNPEPMGSTIALPRAVDG